MFRFADVPLSLSGMTRIAGRRVYLRAPTMEDWAEWAELRARSRTFLTPWEPTWPDNSLGRDHFRRRLRQQVREWRAGEAYGLFIFLNDAAVWSAASISATCAAASPRPRRSATGWASLMPARA